MRSSRYRRTRQPVKDGPFPVPCTSAEVPPRSDAAVGEAPAGSSANAAPGAPERTAIMIQTVIPTLIRLTPNLVLGFLCLGGVHELREAARVCNGHVREDFAIQPDARLLERMDEPGIEQAMGPAGGGDAGYPESSEVALPVA